MPLADHLRELVDAFSDLIANHIRLARVELKEDAKAIGVEVGKVLAFLPLLLVGYIMLAVAAALFLHRFLPGDAAFLIVAVFNLAVGGIGIFLAVKKLQLKQVMDDTRAELETSAVALRPETAARRQFPL
jgi:uncharacterized membrane protein YqjE